MPAEEPSQPDLSSEERRTRLIVFIVFATVLIDFIGFSILIPVLPEYANTLGANAFEVALIVAIYALTQLVFLPAWGWFSDRFGRRPVILVSLAGTMGSFILLAFAEDLATIYLSRILSGFFAASIGAAQAVITDVTPPAQRADGMGKIGAALGVAFVLGPALGGLLAGIGPRVPFYGVSLIAFVNLLVGWFFLPETRPADDRRPELRELLRTLVPTPVRMLSRVHDRRVGLYLYLWFHIYVAFAAVEGSFPLYLIRRYGESSLEVGIMFAWIGVFIAVTQGIIVGRLATWMREGTLVMLGLIITAVGLLAIPLAPDARSLYVVGPIVAIGNGIAFPTFTSLYSQTCEARDAGELLGQGNSMGITGRVVGALCAGWVMDHYGLASPFLVAGIVMFTAALVFGAFHRMLEPGVLEAPPVPDVDSETLA